MFRFMGSMRTKSLSILCFIVLLQPAQCPVIPTVCAEYGGLNGSLQKDPSTSWYVGPVNTIFFRKRRMAGVIQLRLLRWGDFLGICVGLQSNGRCPYKKKAEEELRETEEEEAMWPQGQRPEGCGHKPRRTCGTQKLEEAKKGLYPRTSGSVALLTPWLLTPGVQGWANHYSISCLFWLFHINGIVQYMVFCVWLPKLSIVSPPFIV